ncbi:MAG TPA: DNA-processing protein DprA [Gemmatimonadales bacterium]|nr:DNA-processing protein DprA [Gemmatimonadales bacterium]
MADLASRSRDRVDGLAATLALAQVPNVGPVRLRELVSHFGSAEAALRKRGGRLEDGHAILRRLDELKARVLLEGDPDFPPLLAEMSDPPAILYVWGDLAQTRQRCVAFVGSRNCTEYGLTAARKLARDVAKAGQVTIVSGMARGIDSAAHEVALDVGGGSVGVLGCGFGVIYPPSNGRLYRRMLEHGCLITELPPDQPPHAGAFPRRNRLISGLSRVTVVVEAAMKSGALITVDTALAQGRTVLAVPGPITSPTSYSCNKLIQQGAKPALNAGDILEEIGLPRGDNAGIGDSGLGIGMAASNPESPIPNPQRVAPLDLDDVQRSVWDALGPELQHVDVLVAAGGGDAGRVLTALTDLELRGIVRQEPGMRFGLR